MKDDGVYLRHILDALAKIESYVTVGRDVFMSTSYCRTQWSVNWRSSEKRQSSCPKTSDCDTLLFPGGGLPGCAMF